MNEVITTLLLLHSDLSHYLLVNHCAPGFTPATPMIAKTAQPPLLVADPVAPGAGSRLRSRRRCGL